MYVLYIFTQMVHILLIVMQVLLLLRLIISVGLIDDESHLAVFVEGMTDPILVPIQSILDRFDIIANMPIDLSMITAVILLSILSFVLPVIQP